MPRKAKPEFPSKRIDARIKELSDWRGEALSRIRRLIEQTDSDWLLINVSSSHGPRAILAGAFWTMIVRL